MFILKGGSKRKGLNKLSRLSFGDHTLRRFKKNKVRKEFFKC